MTQLHRFTIAAIISFALLTFESSPAIAASEAPRRVLDLTVMSNERSGDAYTRIGDFMKLEMVFARGDEIENERFRSIGFTGEKTAAFFTPASENPGYGGFFVEIVPAAAKTEDRVRIVTDGFDAMMKDFHSAFGRYVTTFNLSEMPASLLLPECAERVGEKYSAACSPSDLELWRIAVEKSLTHISRTYEIDVQLQLFGEVESRDVWRGFGARNFDGYADNEDFREEENRLTEDYMRLAVATATAVRAVNRHTGRKHITTLWSPSVYSERLTRELNNGLPRNGMETCLAWVEKYNQRTPNSPLVLPTVAMGVQLYDWENTGNLERPLKHLEKLYERYQLPFYVYGFNRSWTSEARMPPHRNAAFVIGGSIQMMSKAFMREGYGYTWTVLGDDDDGRHTMFDPKSNAINAFAAGYQALAIVRGEPGSRFAEVERSGAHNDHVQTVASVQANGDILLLIVNTSDTAEEVSIRVDSPQKKKLQQFWWIGPGPDGRDYSAHGLDERESVTYDRNPAEPFKVSVPAYSMLLVKAS